MNEFGIGRLCLCISVQTLRRKLFASRPLSNQFNAGLLNRSHNVVVLDDFFRAVIGHRQQVWILIFATDLVNRLPLAKFSGFIVIVKRPIFKRSPLAVRGMTLGFFGSTRYFPRI